MHTELEGKWFKLALNYCDNRKLIGEVYGEIRESYLAPGRVYHTLQHLDDLLFLSGKYASALLEKDLVDFAIWFHDIVYVVTSRENELDSADLASRRLRQLNLPEEKIFVIRQFILATRDHRILETSNKVDLEFFLDFDMAILSVDWEMYLNYTRSIRMEYAVFPDEVYLAGRKSFLKKMLSSEAIYHTSVFRQLEVKARENIQRELSSILNTK